MLISAQFDISGSMSTHMPIPIWKRCVNNLLRVRQLLSANSQITLTETAEPEARPAADEIVAGAPVQLWGSLCAFAERLDDEYFKSMQSIDPHTKEHVFRMQDEALFIILANEVISYYVERNNTEVVCKLSLRLLEHLYYKPATVYEALRKFATAKLAEADELAVDEKKPPPPGLPRRRRTRGARRRLRRRATSTSTTRTPMRPRLRRLRDSLPRRFHLPSSRAPRRSLDALARIYKDGDERSKARAMLCDIFNKGLEGDFRRGRDLMLMSHLQENISHTDIATQILFNRAMAQLGLSAPRQVCSPRLRRASAEPLHGRARARAARSGRHAVALPRTQRGAGRSSSAAARCPSTCTSTSSSSRACTWCARCCRRCPTWPTACAARAATTSRSHGSDNYERQTFNGPPDNIRDHIMAATRKMLDGKWKDAKELILGLDVWKLLPGDKDAVLVNVTRRLKEEAMRTHLFQFAAQLASVSLDILAEMFELDFKAAYSLVSRMIMSEELQGMCDDVTRTVVMSHVEPSRLQSPRDDSRRSAPCSWTPTSAR